MTKCNVVQTLECDWRLCKLKFKNGIVSCFFNMGTRCCTLCLKVHLQCKFVYLIEVRSGLEADFLSTCILLFWGCTAVKNRMWFSITPPQTYFQAYCWRNIQDERVLCTNYALVDAFHIILTWILWKLNSRGRRKWSLMLHECLNAPSKL